MSLNNIKCRVNLDKIDESKAFPGKKGRWYTFYLRPTPDSPYGDYMIVEEIPIEDLKAGKRGTIIGNADFQIKQEKDQYEDH